MAMQKDSKISVPADKATAAAPGKGDKNKSLSAEDLDKVSGGINPQPLPPMPRVKQ